MIFLVFYDQWEIMSDLNMSPGKKYNFVSILLLGFNLIIKLRNLDFKIHWNILISLDKKNLVSDLNMSHEKVSDFVLFLCPDTKLRNVDNESHWNTSICFDKKDMVSDLNMTNGKMSDVVSFPLLRITLVIKLRNFYFESHAHMLMFFDKKWCQIWLCPAKQRLIWFKLCCLSKIWQ